jgi:hypothetical protein
MKRIVVFAGVLLGFSVSLVRADIVYTTEASFLAAVNPGYYLNDFTGLAGGSVGNNLAYSGGTPLFGYTISSSSGYLWGVAPGGNPAMSTGFETDNLLVTITTGNVNAIAGNFFLTTDSGGSQSGSVKVTLSDGTIASLPSLSFQGFSTGVASTHITSVLIQSLSTGDADHYPTLDHFYVAAVPEAATWLTSSVLVLACGGVWWYYRRKALAEA